MQIYREKPPSSLLEKEVSFMEIYRATALQRGNLFPSCAWRISQLHRVFSLAFARRFLDFTTLLRQILYLHHTRNDTTLIKLRQRCSKLAVQVLYCFVCIHAALSLFLIFYINSASCRTLFSQITVLNHIQQDGSGSTMFYI